MKTQRIFKLITLIIIVSSLITNKVSGQNPLKSDSLIRLNIKTYDNLNLPAQVISTGNNAKKMILFINGSTPYDEKGNLGAFWNDQGKIITEKHDFYLRFLDIMSNKGYSIATIAKRSFVYPTKIPRPSLAELALDIQFLIEELKRTGLLEDEKELVIVGYSEGSVVATKVLGLLKKQPYACILLGSANMACNCNNQSIEDFYMTDVLRRMKDWTDEQIITEFNQLCQIQKALFNMDEEKFENEYKNSKPYGFGFAAWESFYIDREAAIYDPIPNLLYANVPILICIGSDDMAMPMVSAKNTYERLKNKGFGNVTFRIIEKEVHQYDKYDVFPIIDTWLDNKGQTSDFKLQKSDSLTIAKYAKAKELTNEISAIPFVGSYPEKIITCYRKAVESKMTDASTWFTLGIKLFTNGYNDQAYKSFSNATDSSFAICFASYVWMGHIKDIQNQRKEAIIFYQKALTLYPGFPMQHDQWNLIIDKTWIEERMKTPFLGVKQ